MSDDAELDAMVAVKSALEELEAAARERVLWWACQRFDVAVGDLNGAAGRTSRQDRGDARVGPPDLNGTEGEGVGGPGQFEHFAELYDAVAPTTDHERVLAAAYWAHLQGRATFFSTGLNRDLKDLGHAVGKIARAMQWNIDQKPALILQLKKSGPAAQARKTYKLSYEGIRWVESRLKP